MHDMNCPVLRYFKTRNNAGQKVKDLLNKNKTQVTAIEQKKLNLKSMAEDSGRSHRSHDKNEGHALCVISNRLQNKGWNLRKQA